MVHPAYSRTLAAWQFPGGEDISLQSRSLTPSGITGTTLDTITAGTFISTSTARFFNPAFLAVSSLSVETIIVPSAATQSVFILRVGSQSVITGQPLVMRLLFVSPDHKWSVLRKGTLQDGTQVNNVTQTSDSDNPVVFGAKYHVVFIIESGKFNRIILNGAELALTHKNTIINGADLPIATPLIGNIPIVSTDELSIGDPATSQISFSGTLGRVIVYPYAMTTTQAAANFFLSVDQGRLVSLGAAGAMGAANHGPVAVPFYTSFTTPLVTNGTNFIDLPVATMGFDADGNSLTAVLPVDQPDKGTTTIENGLLRYRPVGSTEVSDPHTVPQRVRDLTAATGLVGDSIVRVPVAPDITTPPTTQWWRQNDIDGRQWPVGQSYYEKDFATWENTMGKPSAITNQSMYKFAEVSSERSWESIWGGEADEQIDNNMTNLRNSQTSTGATFYTVAKQMPVDSCYLVCVVELWPRTVATGEEFFVSMTAPYDFYAASNANKNKLQAGYIRFGRRLYNNFKNHLGWTDTSLLIMRISHEMQQSNLVQVYTSTRNQYRTFAERAYDWMREGFAGPNGDRLRFVHSPGHGKSIAAASDTPLQDYLSYCPRNIDLVTSSQHPGIDTDTQDECLNYLHGRGQRFGRLFGLDVTSAAGAALGVPYCNPEWAPNFEYRLNSQGEVIRNPCNAADLYVQQFRKEMHQMSLDKNFVFETQYNQTMLQENAFEGPLQEGNDAWVRMVRQYKAMFVGDSHAGNTPPNLVCNNFTVIIPAGNNGVTANPIANCTSSTDSVRISNRGVLSASGGLTTSVTGTGANARVQINRGTATNGNKTVVVEMTLLNLPYLLDIRITVSVR